MSAIPTPHEAEQAIKDAKLKAACGLEYAVDLMNTTLMDPTTPLRVVGEVYDRFAKLVGVEKQVERPGSGFKLVINLGNGNRTLEHTVVEVLEPLEDGLEPPPVYISIENTAQNPLELADAA